MDDEFSVDRKIGLCRETSALFEVTLNLIFFAVQNIKFSLYSLQWLHFHNTSFTSTYAKPSNITSLQGQSSCHCVWVTLHNPFNAIYDIMAQTKAIYDMKGPRLTYVSALLCSYAQYLNCRGDASSIEI